MMLLFFVCSIFSQLNHPLNNTDWFGNTPAGIKTNALSIHPDNSLEMIVGYEKGGLWKSNNGGAQWSRITGVLGSNINDVTYSVDGSTIVCAANNIKGFSELGLYISTDGGQSFTFPNVKDTIATESNNETYSLTVNYSNVNCVLASGTYGLALSQNKGVSWKIIKLKGLEKLQVYEAILINENEFIATTEEGIYHIKNQGQDWKLIVKDKFKKQNHQLAMDHENKNLLFYINSSHTLIQLNLHNLKDNEIGLDLANDTLDAVYLTKSQDKNYKLWAKGKYTLKYAEKFVSSQFKALQSSDWTLSYLSNSSKEHLNCLGIFGTSNLKIMSTSEGIFVPINLQYTKWKNTCSIEYILKNMLSLEVQSKLLKNIHLDNLVIEILPSKQSGNAEIAEKTAVEKKKWWQRKNR